MNALKAASRSLARLILLASIALASAACDQPDWIVEDRNITVDLPARLFAATDAAPGLQGPGAQLVRVTVAVKADGEETSFAAEGAAGSVPGGSAYGSLSLPVRGELLSIRASCLTGGAETVSAELSGAEGMDPERYDGFTGFPNLTAFKLDWQAGESSSGYLRILPCPRPNASIACDAFGAADPATDYPALSTRQLAVRLDAQESVAGGVLSYDLYYSLADENLSLCAPADFDGSYLAYPWSERWTYAELTGGVGKRVRDKYYPMTLKSGGHVAGALVDGRSSVLMDFSGVADAVDGKWVVVGVVLHRAGISAAGDAFCVQLR